MHHPDSQPRPTSPATDTAAADGAWPRSLVGFLIGIMATPLIIFVVGRMALSPPSTPSRSVGGENGTGGEQATASVVAPGPSELTVARLDQALDRPDPFASYWNQAAVHEVAVLPQNLVMPAIAEGSIDTLHVQAATDGKRIAWRLSWHDPNPDHAVEAGRFCDAVALQFPVKPGSNVMMGMGGGKVEILHWKAVWQHDLDHGYQDVTDLHANAYTGLYWFATGERPFRIDEAFADPRARQWLIAWSAGNPMSDFERRQPVETAVAEGFGSLTTRPEPLAEARGAWLWDTWAVVFVRDLEPAVEDVYRFTAASETRFAVAVWQGSDGNVGGRKHWSNWVDFRLPEPGPTGDQP